MVSPSTIASASWNLKEQTSLFSWAFAIPNSHAPSLAFQVSLLLQFPPLRTFLKSVSAGHKFFQLSLVCEGLYPWRIFCAGVSSFEKCYPTSFRPPYFWMRNLLSFNFVSIFFNKHYLYPTTLKSFFLCLQYLAVWLWHVLMWVYFCLIYFWFTQLLEPPGRLVSFSGFGVYPPFFFFEHFFLTSPSLYPYPKPPVSWMLDLLLKSRGSLRHTLSFFFPRLFSLCSSAWTIPIVLFFFSPLSHLLWCWVHALSFNFQLLCFSILKFPSGSSLRVLFLFWDVFFAVLGLFTIIQYSLFMLVDLKYFSNSFKISVISTLTSVDCVFSFSLRSLWL